MTTKPIRHPDAPPVGARIEIPAHLDLWMRGARTGTVAHHSRGLNGAPDFIKVRMDHPRVRNLLRIAQSDWTFIKEL